MIVLNKAYNKNTGWYNKKEQDVITGLKQNSIILTVAFPCSSVQCSPFTIGSMGRVNFRFWAHLPSYEQMFSKIQGHTSAVLKI